MKRPCVLCPVLLTGWLEMLMSFAPQGHRPREQTEPGMREGLWFSVHPEIFLQPKKQIMCPTWVLKYFRAIFFSLCFHLWKYCVVANVGLEGGCCLKRKHCRLQIYDAHPLFGLFPLSTVWFICHCTDLYWDVTKVCVHSVLIRFVWPPDPDPQLASGHISFWPCVLRTAASCSFYRAAVRKTWPCSSRWSVQQRIHPLDGEQGWGTCTAPGDQNREWFIWNRDTLSVSILYQLFWSSRGEKNITN